MPTPSQYPLGMRIFRVHWSKGGGSCETHRINSVVAVAKARQLEASGYQVRITDRRGRQFAPCEFGELLHQKSGCWPCPSAVHGVAPLDFIGVVPFAGFRGWAVLAN
jgi:hypothetical protein